MRETDRPAFAEIILALAAVYRVEVGDFLIEGYWMGLADLPIATLKRAAARAMRENRFMPNVAELRALSGETPAADRAPVAWSVVKKAMAQHGYYGSVDFDDVAINATIRNLGGWEALDDLIERQGEVWVRKDFERIYQAYVRRGVTAEEAAPLGGYLSRLNGSTFPERVPVPARIACGTPSVPLIASSAPAGRGSAAALGVENIGLLPKE